MPARQYNRLTDVQARRAPPGTHGDGHGLMLVVQPSGSRSWVQRLMIQSRRVDIGLGGYPLVTLAKARDDALDNRRIARNGGDPRRQARAPTFADAQAAALEQKRTQWKAGSKGARDWQASMRAHVLPKIGPVPVSDVGTRDIDSVLRPLAEAGTHALVQALAPRLTATLDWATIQEHRTAGDPVRPVMRNMPKRNGGAKHHKALRWADVGSALAQFDTTQCARATKLATRFIALTAARPGEVRLAAWDQIDMDTAVWTRPASMMKAGKEHRIPLSTAALDVLCDARKLPRGTGLLFPGQGRKPIGESTLSGAMRDHGVAATPHGFRSSFATWAQEQGIEKDLREFALAHVEGSQTVAAYARSDLLERRRPVMQAWADAIAG